MSKGYYTPLSSSTPLRARDPTNSEARFVTVRQRRVHFNNMAGADSEGQIPDVGGDGDEIEERVRDTEEGVDENNMSNLEKFRSSEERDRYFNIVYKADAETKARYRDLALKAVICSPEERQGLTIDFHILGYLINENDDMQHQLKCCIYEHLLEMRLNKPQSLTPDANKTGRKRQSDSQPGLNISQIASTKAKRRSYGAVVQGSVDVEEEEVSVRTNERKNAGGGQVGMDQSIFPISASNTVGWAIPFMRGEIGRFRGTPGTDGSQFLKNYEQMTVNWSDQSRVDSFAHFLREDASDWLETIEQDMKQEVTFNEQGIQSNAWLDLTWLQLKRLFEKEYLEDKVKSFITCRQAPSELGQTYFYRIAKLHMRSGLGLPEDSMTKMIVEHMQPQYQSVFKYKNFKTMKALRDAIRLYDSKRRDELLDKQKKSKLDKHLADLGMDLDLDDSTISAIRTGTRSLPNIEMITSDTIKINEDELTRKIAEACDKCVREVTQKLRADTRREHSPRQDRDRHSSRPRANAYKQDKNCYNCGKLGHLQKDCWSPGGAAYGKPRTTNGSNRQRQRYSNRSSVPGSTIIKDEQTSENSQRQ